MDYRKTFSRISFIAWSTIAVTFAMWSIDPHMVEAQPLFQPKIDLEAGENPRSVAIDDLDGNDTLDLVVANGESNNVSVILNNGDGTFQSAVSFNAGGPASWRPGAVAIGDLNGDNDLDLAVAINSNVSVLLGNGDGTFQSAVSYACQNPASIAIGDLNGDDDPDLAVGGGDESAFSVLIGNGDGTFQNAVYYKGGFEHNGIAIGDLNKDSNLDIVAGDWGYNAIKVFLGNGDGTFQNAVSYYSPGGAMSVAIGDLNGDDNLDVAAGNWSTSPPDEPSISVFLGNGDGTVQDAVYYQSENRNTSVVIGDLDLDGALDLAVNNAEYTDNVSVLLNNGDGTFQSAENYDTGGANSIAMGDLNRDGALDVAVANSDGVSILYSNKGFLEIFIDVPPGYWAEDAIYKIYEAGITKGCCQDPLKFCPENTVYRDQMAVFLGRATHESNFTPPDATGIFADVPTWYWAANWIEQFYDDGLTNGCKIDPHSAAPVMYYCPKYPVTRTTMAIFLLRAKHGANYQPPPATGIFGDVWVNYWAAAWIEQLYKEGITKGCKSNPLMYCPSNHVTRAQMAMFLARMLGL